MTQNKRFSHYTYAGAVFVLALCFGASANFAYAGDNHDTGSGIKIQIDADGDALVRGAKVTSVSSTTVNANTSLGSSVLSWIVKTDSNTDFISVKGAAEGLANIAVGDIISFRGTVDQSVSGLTVKAEQVKDWTAVETKAKIEGIVTSINATLGSFTIKNGSGTTTVQTGSSTSFKKDGVAATFASLFLNAKVKVQGLLNASSSVVTAQSVAIDTDDDNSWDHNDRKEWRTWIKSKVWLNWHNH